MCRARHRAPHPRPALPPPPDHLPGRLPRRSVPPALTPPPNLTSRRDAHAGPSRPHRALRHRTTSTQAAPLLSARHILATTLQGTSIGVVVALAPCAAAVPTQFGSEPPRTMRRTPALPSRCAAARFGGRRPRREVPANYAGRFPLHSRCRGLVCGISRMPNRSSPPCRRRGDTCSPLGRRAASCALDESSSPCPPACRDLQREASDACQKRAHESCVDRAMAMRVCDWQPA